MFGIGMPEMIVILVIALIVIGPKKLPDLAKSMGRAMREFKRATSEFKDSLDVENDLSDVKDSIDDINKNIKDTLSLKPDKGKPGEKKIEPGETTDPSADEKPVGHLENISRAFENVELEIEKDPTALPGTGGAPAAANESDPPKGPDNDH